MMGSTPSQATLDVPDEVLVDILKHVDSKTLVKCRLVCKLWKQVIDNDVWREKARIGCYRSLRDPGPRRKVPNHVYYWICTRDPFDKNLVKNNCGQDKLKHWKILSSGGNRWKVEDPPQGADPLPQGEEFGNHTCCFATSYHSCTKEQKIDLWKVAVPGKILDDVQPVVEISEWYAGRFDCGCVYDIETKILDAREECMQGIKRRENVEQWQGGAWHKVQYSFQEYGPGLRYVVFYHGGMDKQFWAGHYGSKMSGACVKLMLPPPKSVHSSDCTTCSSSSDGELD